LSNIIQKGVADTQFAIPNFKTGEYWYV